MDRIRAHTRNAGVLDLAPAPDKPLSRILFLAGAWPDVPLCAGLGRCGLCRVRYLSAPPEAKGPEVRRLGAEAVSQGWRLSCLHPAAACELELPPPARAGLRSMHVLETEKTGLKLSLAVDLGTTSISWEALDGPDTAAQGGELNPQIGLGGEVLSRLALATEPGGLDLLQGLVLDRLSALCSTLGRELGRPVERLGVAANPAMTAILLGLDAPGLRAAPYRLDYAGGEDRELPGLPPVRIPPMLAPFVGGDLSAGLAALRFGPQDADTPLKPPYLLADLGTNGELVLALSENEFLLASVPMGPALEGVGLSCGRTAGPGAAVAFRLAPSGPLPEYLDRPPDADDSPGMSGTGAISLVGLLLRNKILTEQGAFASGGDPSPLAARLAAHVVRDERETRFTLDPGQGHGELALTAADVEELLKVKAAFHLALDRLLDAAGLTHQDLDSVRLAGALGGHVNTTDLETLGFLPPGLGQRTVKAGNTSLAGMRLLLQNPDAWAWTLELPGRCRVLDLAEAPGFQSDYLQRMRFSHD